MSTKGWGFNLKNIDKKVRPQDDFYHYAIGGWLKANTIPASEARWGSITILRHRTDKQLKTLLNEVEQTKSLPSGSPGQMIRDLYRSGMDMKRRNALGIKPLEKWRKKIAQLSSKEEVLVLVAELHRIGVGVLWGAAIEQNMKKADWYQLYLYQDGLGMPDRDYYLLNGPEQKRVRAAYLPYVESMLRLAGYAKRDAQEAATVVLAIETRLAKASMKNEDMREPAKTYHKHTVRDLCRLTPSIDWKTYLRLTGADVRDVNVMQPAFLKEAERVLKNTPLADLKTYFDWHVVNDMSGFLSQQFVKQKFSFYGTVLTGTKQMKPQWRRMLGMVNACLGEQLGKLYVQKYFGKAAKDRLNEIVDDLFVVFDKRIQVLDWMSPVTKKRALVKLRAIKRKLGYPDKWKSYKGLVIKEDDYFGNILRSTEYEHRRAMKKLKKPVDRTEWYDYPQTVNAFYNPPMNDMLFPAGILQHPFFSLDADDALNYAAMGMCIGHEMTHAFDNQGAQYDSKGNFKNWWTNTDKKRFEKKGAVVKKQFDHYVVEGLHVNGKLTLGENIADLGGLSIAFSAYQRSLEKTGRKTIDGLTPEQRFFLAYAQCEHELSRPEIVKLAILTDPHAPAITRVNGPLSNMIEFYEAFGVKKGDKLYRSPSQRAKIW